MTPRQRSYFFSYLWPEVCRIRCLQPDNRDMRMDFFADVFGEPKSFANLTEEDYDRLKAACLAIIKPESVDAQLAQLNMPRRRLVERVTQLEKCVALYVESPRAYLAQILRQRFHVAEAGALALPDLEKYSWTLARCLNGEHGLRTRAGDSLHTMNQRAGLPCDCKLCASQPQENVAERPF